MPGLGEHSLNSPIPSILKVNFLPRSPTLDRVGEVWNWSPGGWDQEAAPLLHAGLRRHHYQAVLEIRHYPMLPSKMATAAQVGYGGRLAGS